MSVYLIALDEPNAEAWDRLKEEWSSRYLILNDRIALVSPEGISLTEDVCDVVGTNDAHEVTGFVAEVNYDAFNGWTNPRLWEWLRKHR